MKVLIVSKALMARTYRHKLTEMVRLGMEVTAVVPPYWREGGAIQQFEPSAEDAFNLIVSPMRWNGHFHLHYYPELRAIMRRVRPDELHFDEEPYNLATYHGVRLAQRFKVPSLFFSWQNIERRYPPPFAQIENRVYRAVGAAIAGSDSVAAVLRAKGYGGPLVVAPQFGVDTQLFQPSSPPTGPFTIGFLNRMIPAKAPLLMLDAFAHLSPDTRLLMIGDGPLRAEVEVEVARRGWQNRVTVRARMPSSEIPAVMRELNALVLPSITTSGWKEQFGRVLPEAMAVGVPVVGSDSGEIPEVIGNAGLIVPEGDAEALAQSLIRLHNDAILCADLARRGRERAVRCYSNEVVARRTIEAYSLALAT